MNLHPFVDNVINLKFKNCFNPYSDLCEVHDRHHAPQIRAQSLSAMVLQAERVQVDALWLGRDLGHRGGRRTGLAFTDDLHIEMHAKRWGNEAERATAGKAVKERTAEVIWNVLENIDSHIFLWNVFPLHPHEPGEPLSNRLHNAGERRAGEKILHSLVRLLAPARVVAIGNDAAIVAERVVGSIPVFKVRHPSYGGQSQFVEQIKSLYGLPS